MNSENSEFGELEALEIAALEWLVKQPFKSTTENQTGECVPAEAFKNIVGEPHLGKGL